MILIQYLSSHTEVTIYVDIRENFEKKTKQKQNKWPLEKFHLCLADFSLFDNFNVLIHMLL